MFIEISIAFRGAVCNSVVAQVPATPIKRRRSATAEFPVFAFLACRSRHKRAGA